MVEDNCPYLEAEDELDVVVDEAGRPLKKPWWVVKAKGGGGGEEEEGEGGGTEDSFQVDVLGDGESGVAEGRPSGDGQMFANGPGAAAAGLGAGSSAADGIWAPVLGVGGHRPSPAIDRRCTGRVREGGSTRRSW